MKVYIKIDDKNRIIAIDSSVFLKNTSDWIQLDEGKGEPYVHAQSGYLSKSLYEEHGIPRYKFSDGVVTERTEEEIAADIPALPPAPPSNAELAAIMENTMKGLFDGLKWIADPNNPIPLAFPMVVHKNLIYLYNGTRYVSFTEGVVYESDFTPENFPEY